MMQVERLLPLIDAFALVMLYNDGAEIACVDLKSDDVIWYYKPPHGHIIEQAGSVQSSNAELAMCRLVEHVILGDEPLAGASRCGWLSNGTADDWRWGMMETETETASSLAVAMGTE